MARKGRQRPCLHAPPHAQPLALRLLAPLLALRACGGLVSEPAAPPLDARAALEGLDVAALAAAAAAAGAGGLVAGRPFAPAAAGAPPRLELRVLRADAFGRLAVDASVGADVWARLSAQRLDNDDGDDGSYGGNGHRGNADGDDGGRRVSARPRRLWRTVPLSGRDALVARFAAGVAQWDARALFVNASGLLRLQASVGGGVGPAAPRAPPLASVAFNVSRGAPARLALARQPGDATGGRPFSPQPVVVVVDDAGEECGDGGGGDGGSGDTRRRRRRRRRRRTAESE